jgi:hypothetical protein
MAASAVGRNLEALTLGNTTGSFFTQYCLVRL